MSFVVYFFVALIAAFSVVFGLDFVPAPMSPMPASKYALRAAVPPAPPAPVVAKVEPKTEAVAAAVAMAAAPAPVAPVPAPAPPSVMANQQPASIVASEPGTTVAVTAAPRCDLDACAAAYRTFDPADCTYKPSEGPRRLCMKGTPPQAPAAAAMPATTPAAPETRAQACNIAACSQSYARSFSAADCTFQPSEGPRRFCTK